MNLKPHRRSPRLKDFDYLGPLAAHLVFVTRERAPLFLDPDNASTALDQLTKVGGRFRVEVHAYCFMPDHVHLLVEVPHGTSLTEFVRIYKQTSSFAIKKRTGDEVWQISYFDRVLRKEDALEDVAAYIWNNPVEEGIVKNREDYPFSGPRGRM
jgi:putative transposase